MLDLEDLVHDQRKFAARANIRAGIDRARQGGAEVFVRCDLELLYADLDASVWRGLQGVVLPKVTAVAQIREAEEILAHFENERASCRPGSCTKSTSSTSRAPSTTRWDSPVARKRRGQSVRLWS